MVKLTSHKSLEYPELLIDSLLKIYIEKSVIMVASAAPSNVHMKKLA
jgi:hypothetical protein